MKLHLTTNRFELAALLRKLYELDLEQEEYYLSDAQLLSIPYLRKLRSRMEKKLLNAKPGKDFKIIISKFEVVAIQTVLQNNLDDLFFSSVFFKIEKLYLTIQNILKIRN